MIGLNRNERSQSPKYATNTGFFKTKDGRCWAVNTGPGLSPLYTDILQCLVGQLEAMESHYARVFCFRFDLHLTAYTDDNATVSRLLSLVVQALKRYYKTPNIGYLWVREHEKAKQQHYHCVLFLDGSKVNHFHTIQTTIDDYWAAFEGGHVQGCGFKVLPEGTHTPKLRSSTGCRISLKCVAKPMEKENAIGPAKLNATVSVGLKSKRKIAHL
ncbi:YagK/YfjJ domain-containing protein [Salinivibrio socompensis]|uniref:YagK/YfjJ domain-containing protein n=1 Tax=Salinivibrio socompensis TaxID=1510206 RepID=UPI0004718084|nr:inovirus-type Gp2 protein [Salinivibrio socompensis]